MKRIGGVAIALSGLAWILSISVWVADDPRLNETAYDTFSTYNTSPGGLSQVFGYLSVRRGSSAVRRLTAAADLRSIPANATLFRIGSVPEPVTITSREAERARKKKTAKEDRDLEPRVKHRLDKLLDDPEEQWVRSGGRMVIAPTDAVGSIQLSTKRCEAVHNVFPLVPPLPAPVVPVCRELSGPGLRHFHTLQLNGSAPVIVRSRIGRGEVFIVSIPELFSNEVVGDGVNLEMLERLAGAGRPVWFDETVHGIDTGRSLAGMLVAEWRLGPALALLAVACVAAFWRKARRVGAPDRLVADIRTDAVDLVDSLGRLYDGALDREECLRRYFQSILRAYHARTGLAGEALDRYVRARTSGYDPAHRFEDISRDEFHRLLSILNRAYEMVTHANTR